MLLAKWNCTQPFIICHSIGRWTKSTQKKWEAERNIRTLTQVLCCHLSSLSGAICQLYGVWLTVLSLLLLDEYSFLLLGLCSSSCIAFFIKESTQNYLYFKSHKTFRLEIAWRPVRTKTRPLVKLSDCAVPLPSCLLVNINFIHGKIGFKVCF